MFGSNKALRVWVPYSTMANRLMGRSYFDSITVRIKEGYSSKEAEQQLVRLLTLRHGKKTYLLIIWIACCRRLKNNADYAIVSNIGGGYFTGGWRNRRDEYYAGFRNRADA